jgi:hypothetical protein
MTRLPRNANEMVQGLIARLWPIKARSAGLLRMASGPVGEFARRVPERHRLLQRREDGCHGPARPVLARVQHDVGFKRSGDRIERSPRSASGLGSPGGGALRLVS